MSYKMALRELVPLALTAAGALRDSPAPQQDSMKLALSSTQLAQKIVDKYEAGQDVRTMAIELGQLAQAGVRDKSFSRFSQYVGGSQDPWNNWEWSIYLEEGDNTP